MQNKNFLDMRNIKISLSVTQDLFLRSSIRKEIQHNYALLDYYRSECIDISPIIDDIFDLKSLYRQLTGKPFKF